ncbi:hypothetical protein COU78_05340 [Candidatus Peregrinibacteria bacterium CG10_big_fil_rev_8_21_14_0_10_49_24]|nr:MAG: hypothetical protein COV83_01710 [Candidatus Peregrinibacteria bacterium CG11_big_fil_rev_8_21_14_0_20_49_14]PIR50769.1 MAG: hypothetical protein COU78_05340 [Candidatus Peregrinibacteria bacterium CG10_big_fil_rev_8_21_14_0_10_49_24]PJA68186.1 MAG: hypothetical protein CO157_00470 [Candidatus Peregrinibacteria bacterium CG_4_9_14_3_um_filter_49_12]
MIRNKPSVSIIIPARNEGGHIEDIFRRMPSLSPEQELIFIEGNSSDNTWKEIQRCASAYSEKWPATVLLQQDGHGKADAVWKGIALASGEIIMILDADITVPPESLRDFYTPFQNKTAAFTYGSRLVHPMEKGAMRFCNYFANAMFAFLWRPLLHYPITDTLCGTKVFYKKDYETSRKKFPKVFDADPYGDFALLFTAAMHRSTIKEVPIHYKARQYGTTNISRWKGGIQLMNLYLLSMRTLLLEAL